MINTLNVATRGYLPSRTPLSVSVQGWLGSIGSQFKLFNENVWELTTKGTNWTMSRNQENWNITAQRIKWNVVLDEE
jgi:hypothetical protein